MMKSYSLLVWIDEHPPKEYEFPTLESALSVAEKYKDKRCCITEKIPFVGERLIWSSEKDR